MTNKGIMFLIAVALALAIAAICSTSVFETVQGGTYHIKQAAISGELTAKMKPGMYGQWFGDVSIWPVAETFYFTSDQEGGHGDASVEVRFNDGSSCKISGTCRVELPKTETDAIALVKDYGFRNHDQLEEKLILPVIRKSFILTANLMSAKESITDKRAEFLQYSWDQIEHGPYITRDVAIKEIDPVSGQPVTHFRKELVRDENGKPLRDKNPLEGVGIRLSNFEIKNFIYEDRVQKQIATQQEALMAVQTARANAQKAEQDALTIKAQGEAEVMKAKYEEEQKKIRATVEAEKEKAVAVITAQKFVEVSEKEKEQALIVAQKQKEVATIDLEAAKLEKQRQIELGTGEAERKRLVLLADGALAQKLEAWVKSQEVWANAFSTRKVPSVVMAGKDGAGTDGDAQMFMQLLGVKAAKDLAVDLEMRSGTATK